MIDSVIENITSSSSFEFILGDVGSTINFTNVQYKSSGVMFLRISSSRAFTDQLIFENIHGAKDLLRVENSDQSVWNNIEIKNSTVTSESFIFISKSQGIKMKNFKTSNSQKNVISITNSNILLVEGVDIQNSSRAIQIKSSGVENMTGCTFSHNGKANKSVGGAIHMINTQVTVTNCTFSHNVGLRGAAIVFECTSSTSCDLNLDYVVFTSNKALEQGGAIDYNYIRPDIVECTFTNNSAQYGPDIASYPVKIRMTEGIHSDIHLQDIGPGIDMDVPLSLSLLDFDNQTMVLNSLDQISIFAVNTSEASTTGTNTVRLRNGVAVFDAIQFVSEIGTEAVEYNAVSKAIDTSKVKKIHGAKFSTNDILVDLRF